MTKLITFLLLLSLEGMGQSKDTVKADLVIKQNYPYSEETIRMFPGYVIVDSISCNCSDSVKMEFPVIFLNRFKRKFSSWETLVGYQKRNWK